MDVVGTDAESTPVVDVWESVPALAWLAWLNGVAEGRRKVSVPLDDRPSRLDLYYGQPIHHRRCKVQIDTA